MESFLPLMDEYRIEQRKSDLSVFFSPHGKYEDAPTQTSFRYPQGRSVYPIYNTVGQYGL